MEIVPRVGGLSRVGFGGVDCVVGCDGVGGVVGSGTCCAGFLLNILHLPAKLLGSSRRAQFVTKKMLSV